MLNIDIRQIRKKLLGDLKSGTGHNRCSREDIDLPVEAGLELAQKTKIRAGEKVVLINLSKNANHYIWDFGDGCISTRPHPIHTYDTAGTYKIVLIAINEEGADAATLKLNIPAPEPKIPAKEAEWKKQKIDSF
jgi:hypothetical protein